MTKNIDIKPIKSSQIISVRNFNMFLDFNNNEIVPKDYLYSHAHTLTSITNNSCESKEISKLNSEIITIVEDAYGEGLKFSNYGAVTMKKSSKKIIDRAKARHKRIRIYDFKVEEDAVIKIQSYYRRYAKKLLKELMNIPNSTLIWYGIYRGYTRGILYGNAKRRLGLTLRKGKAKPSLNKEFTFNYEKILGLTTLNQLWIQIFKNGKGDKRAVHFYC